MAIIAATKQAKIAARRILLHAVRYPNLPIKLITDDARMRHFIIIEEGVVITADADGMMGARKRSWLILTMGESIPEKESWLIWHRALSSRDIRYSPITNRSLKIFANSSNNFQWENWKAAMETQIVKSSNEKRHSPRRSITKKMRDYDPESNRSLNNQKNNR